MKVFGKYMGCELRFTLDWKYLSKNRILNIKLIKIC